MIDVLLLRKEPDRVKQGIAAKGADPALVDEFLKLDSAWRGVTEELGNRRGFHKAQSDEYARAKQMGVRREGLTEESLKEDKEAVRIYEEKEKAFAEKRLAVWRQIPNLPLPEVPVGNSDADNKVLREEGKRTTFDFPAKDYLAHAESLGLVDMERGAKVSGSRFGFILGAAAKLEFALVQLAIRTAGDRSVLASIIKEKKLELSDAPFVPVVPPVLISAGSMSAMGYLDRGADDMYHLPKDNLYLVGTSEQSIGPMHKDEVFDAKDMPKRYLGFSTCFRREAGSYGKDMKGILRVHQFDKLEMFSFVMPEQSHEEHELLLGIQEYLMRELKIPYRVVDICSADLGDPAAKKYDIEAWMPGQNERKGEYRETHSTSNCTDYQARRLNIKYRTPDGKAEFAHTLNGTAFAIGRTLIAIIENYQTADGKVRVPDVLQPYAGQKVVG